MDPREVVHRLDLIEARMKSDRDESRRDREDMRGLLAELRSTMREQADAVRGLADAVQSLPDAMRTLASSVTGGPGGSVTLDRRTFGWLVLGIVVVSMGSAIGTVGGRELLSILAKAIAQ